MTKRFIIPGGITLVILIVLPLIVYFTSQQNFRSNAAGMIATEAETGTKAGTVTTVNDANASGGQYVRIGSSADLSARIFTGDYETGNFSQWSNCQNVYLNDPCTGINPSHYAAQIVTNPVRQGTYAARYEVRNGDVPNFGGGERSEVAHNAGGAVEGDDRWYQWSTQFTPSFPAAGWGTVVSQWHDSSNNSPPLSFDVLPNGTWGLMKNGNTWLWLTPQTPGTWEDIKIHIKWSSNSAIGFVELWKNGVKQTFTGGGCASQTKCMTSTIGTGGIYFKQGIYRDATNTATGVIYHDGFSAASSELGLLPLQ